MKALVAAAIVAILSLFGIHQAPPRTARTPPSAQVASAVSAVEDPFHPASSDPRTTTPHSALADSTHAMNSQTSLEASSGTAGQASSAETTIVKQPARLNDVSRSGGYITQPVIEKIVQSAPFDTGRVLGASTDDTAAKFTPLETKILTGLADLQNQINALAHAPQQVFVPSFSGPAATTPVSTATFAQSQKIDQLSGTSLSNVTVNGVSGLTASDIPTLSYLPLSGGTVTGDLTVNGSFSSGSLSLSIASTTDLIATNATTTNATTTNFAALGTITAPYYTATSTTVASIFNGGFLSLASSTIGSGTQADGLTISGGATTTLNAYFGNKIGVGTQAPSYSLDVSGFINTNQFSGYKQNGTTILVATSAPAALSVGVGLNAARTGIGNIAIGYPGAGAPLANLTTGGNNIGIDSYALFSDTTGGFNIAMGYTSLFSNTTGSNNIGIGYQALRYNVSATTTVAIGANAGKGNASGYNSQGSTYLGYNTAASLQTGSDYNTLIGYNAGTDITTGQYNTLLGQFVTSGVSVTSGSNNILIGQGVRAGFTVTGSNQINIGNLIFGTGLSNNATMSTGNVGVGTTSPYALLSISNSKNTAANTPLFVIASTTGGTATTTVLSVASTGDVTIIGSATACIIGNGAGPTSCTASDQRLKDNITGLDASSSLSAVRQLNPVSFDWNSFMTGNGAPTSTQFGFIAQDVAKVLPNLVAQDAHSGYFKLDYQGLFAPIVAAIQVLAQKVDELAATVATFADHFTTKELTFTRATGDEIDVRRLCVRDTAGATCISRAQLDALLQDYSKLIPKA